MNSVYVRGLIRFWWVVLIGLGVALFGAVASVDHINFSTAPPKLTPRAHVQYSSSAQLMVDSPSSPFFRTEVTNVVGGARTITHSGSTGGTPATTVVPAQVRTEAPDTSVLVNAANLYPLIIQSDAITKLRIKMFGNIPGGVTAQAALSSATPFGPYRPSPVPVINIGGISSTPRYAKKVVQQTVVAFARWLADNQRHAGVQPNQRIIIRELQSPLGYATIGGTSYTTAGIVFIGVVAAFAALAILLAHVVPVREGAERRTAAPGAAPPEVTTP